MNLKYSRISIVVCACTVYNERACVCMNVYILCGCMQIHHKYKAKGTLSSKDVMWVTEHEIALTMAWAGVVQNHALNKTNVHISGMFCMFVQIYS